MRESHTFVPLCIWLPVAEVVPRICIHKLQRRLDDLFRLHEPLGVLPILVVQDVTLINRAVFPDIVEHCFIQLPVIRILRSWPRDDGVLAVPLVDRVVHGVLLSRCLCRFGRRCMLRCIRRSQWLLGCLINVKILLVMMNQLIDAVALLAVRFLRLRSNLWHIQLIIRIILEISNLCIDSFFQLLLN